MAVGANDILRVAVRFKWDGLSDIVNVWHLRVTQLGSAGDDGEVMAALADIFQILYSPLMDSVPNNVTSEDISGVNITENELLPVTPITFNGASVAQGFPLQTTPMVQFQSGTPRHGSRIYLPPIDETGAADGIIEAAVLALLEAFAADVLGGLIDPVTDFTASRVAYERGTGLARTLLTAFVPTVLRTQRRRRQGVGS